ncbi:MAG: hypothetical protein KKH08_06125 [Candidatus Omnitrophica bacterium]|nr:hypothetical protein [Candidatus Omnitrophota bacterium]
MQTIVDKIKNDIYKQKRGFVFTKYRFFDLGNPKTISKVLERMVESGEIRRIARGIYDYPKKHPEFGNIPPDPNKIADALAEKDNLKIQPSGAYAANLLGLSDQVPAKYVFLTDGHSRTVQVGKLNIKLKKTTPKNMATAGRISGLVIQALRYMGQKNVDDRVINILNRKLSDTDKKTLMADLRYAPAWIDKVLRRLNEK